MGGETFGWAIKQLQNSARVYREGWNGKNMFLFLIRGSGEPSSWTYTDGKQDNYPCLPFIAIKTIDDKVVPWLGSQTDVLANDWYSHLN